MGNTKPVGVAYSDPEINGGSISGATVSGCTINNDVTGDVTGNVAGYVIFPSADPLVAGAWWDDEGTLTKSTGE
jgi:hypothetical protein